MGEGLLTGACVTQGQWHHQISPLTPVMGDKT